ncbi:helix-turn-helix transcriptional regulator [Salipaludibacillus agaradhaerens]|jgi:transcriptional regulator with XRE-family HTH domain|uniref:Helix-turn-helix transcriptional regulator n=1 Tax=Salipaludibacillus agaradhaerens TaxID=76935 RepID=A0A9Q4B2Q5_SALAG|nr:helix-turn-helix transcriptional regulator [Salipaludibacillus agaradhaerens]MCR6096912.1 helix-turn-helix transcriptional regulator [Salipaludibacillus agaradhaerens]MCR6116682.1 helix-turn-helix transcriptional regulator [Salipaludibacillus agaradhaerens]
MSLGDKIKNKRKTNKLTQKELGKSVGVSEAAISQYESNTRHPDWETIQKIANTLKVNPYYFLDIDEETETKDILEVLESSNLTLEGKLLTVEEKERAIQIIKLMLNTKDTQ